MTELIWGATTVGQDHVRLSYAVFDQKRYKYYIRARAELLMAGFGKTASGQRAALIGCKFNERAMVVTPIFANGGEISLVVFSIDGLAATVIMGYGRNRGWYFVQPNRSAVQTGGCLKFAQEFFDSGLLVNAAETVFCPDGEQVVAVADAWEDGELLIGTDARKLKAAYDLTHEGYFVCNS